MAIPSVLICGKIRDADAFAQDLSVYARWRAEGQIARIVFSGWNDDRNHPLIQQMADMGVEITLSQQPVLKGSGFILHQMKSIHYGLQRFADNEPVFRTRTDKTWLNFELSSVFERWVTAPDVASDSPFSRRIIVPAILPLQPFFFNDMMFFGQASDLRRLISFDLWFELEHAVINPEQIFHFYPFRHHAMHTRRFLAVNPGLEHTDAAMSVAIYKWLLGRELYLRAVAESLMAFAGSYIMGLRDPGVFQAPVVPHLEGLLGLPVRAQQPHEHVWLEPGANNIVADHGASVDWLLDLAIRPNDPRTLRIIAHEPAMAAPACDASATALADLFKVQFPGRDNQPAAPYFDGQVTMIPPRTQNIVAA